MERAHPPIIMHPKSSEMASDLMGPTRSRSLVAGYCARMVAIETVPTRMLMTSREYRNWVTSIP